MKLYNFKRIHLVIVFSFLLACKSESKKEIDASSSTKYSISVTATTKKNAPALQSFVHGVSGSEWLLFGGRTNTKTTYEGGLHDLDSNYTNTSFIPRSFNDSIYVYNVDTDTSKSMSISQMVSAVTGYRPSYGFILSKYLSIFKNTNALVRQDGDFLYVVGGFGPKDLKNPTSNYITYNQIARIHIPSLISVVKGNSAGVDLDNLFAFGQNTSLISTGGELHKFNGSFYLATGHNFGNNAPNFQKYVDAVYPFTVAVNTTTHVLTPSVGVAITDVTNPTSPIADNLSTFRRRDGPIVPSIYKSPVSGNIEPGLAIYAGVFKPGDDNNLQAWNDAIYIHPSWSNSDAKIFTHDKSYNQKNYNVYASPNFVMYDATTDITHTYLFGGIGDGAGAPGEHLSGFTNTGVHIQTNIGTYPISSTNTVFSQNVFGSTTNVKPFYGAEAILFPNKALTYFVAGSETTEIIDLAKNTGSTIDIGYIYGGIEANAPNPGGYGANKSSATNKIWKVTVNK